MTATVFTTGDRQALDQRGIGETEVARQLSLLRTPPPPVRLLRPCRPSDGIVQLAPQDHDDLLARQQTAAAAGRLTKLVAASGAASRMFQSLLALHTAADAGSDADRDALAQVRTRLGDFAFGDDIVGAQALTDDALLHRLLDAEGLDLARRPKALIPFHRYPGQAGRTAFEEHLFEGASYLRDQHGRCRYHFTVTPQHEAAFHAVLEGPAQALADHLGVQFEVTFSSQSPATDTIAATLDGMPFRSDDGALLFRPGGHGALLRNLAQLEGDIVYLRTIDNVVPASRQPLVVHWQRLLAGHLLALQEQIFSILSRLDNRDADGPWLDAALAWTARTFGAARAASLRGDDPTTQRAYLDARLRRPLRVCGMVRNEGEPGGGPFWLADTDGEAAVQIVEMAQIDGRDPAQRAIVDQATHFNPVAIVCGVRDHRDQPFDLDAFVDPDQVFIAEKSAAGRPLRALEHPGLWNGAMARWNSVFIEIPAATFAPVKTILDLLRPAHQP